MQRQLAPAPKTVKNLCPAQRPLRSETPVVQDSLGRSARASSIGSSLNISRFPVLTSVRLFAKPTLSADTSHRSAATSASSTTPATKLSRAPPAPLVQPTRAGTNAILRLISRLFFLADGPRTGMTLVLPNSLPPWSW